jgi:uncharacterized protein YcfJ
MIKYILPAIMLLMAFNVNAYGSQRIQSTYVDADVISVRPVFSQGRCYSTNTYQPQYEQAPRSRTAPILGGIVGAAIGNQVGDGRGRDAATVAGAVLGYNITRDTQERNRYNERQYGQHRGRSYERCEEQRVEAYDVVFYFNGREYQTRALYNPGPTIRLRVDFSIEQ